MRILRLAAQLALVLVSGLEPALAGESPAPARPSVLLVTFDTTRADHLGCYGAPSAQTPNLDALAAQGARFEHALAPAPLTLPSHATILTGRVPRRHGARTNTGFRLDPAVSTLAELLREHGYRTAAFVSSAVLDRVTGLDRGFEVYDDAVGTHSGPLPGERSAAATTEAAIAQLRQWRQQRFFVWVHYFDPHEPYAPPDPWNSRFRERPYDGEIAFADDAFGRLWRAAREHAGRPLLVIVAADHGESLGEHSEATHGIFLYQATQRVPWLVAGPGIAPRRVVRETVGLVDLAPTLLELLELPPLPDTDGRSLAHLLRGNGEAPAGQRADYELETFYPALAYGWAPLRALVRGRLKYIEAPQREAYDLRADPGERRNLWEERPPWAAELARLLRDRAGEDAPVPARESDERRARLESLGYVSGGTPGELDPKEGIRTLELFERARRALAAGKADEAAEQLAKLLAAQPSHRRGWLLLAQCRLAQGRPEQAAGAARRAVALWRRDPQAHLALANALARLEPSPERDAQASGHYEEALRLHPRYAEAYLSYASWALRRRGPEAAAGILERARREGVALPDVEVELGILAKMRGDAAAARRAFERALELDPNAAAAWVGLAEVAYAAGNPAEAARLYARALELRPTAVIAKTLGAIRLNDLDDVKGALDAFREALRLTPPDDPDRATLEELVRELEAQLR